MTTSSLDLVQGTVIGGFRVERPLSAGGMGSVYVATQLNTGRLRALKLMHPSLVKDAKYRTRFEQEAQVGARIASEHVVEVVDAGVDAQRGIPYLAMELLEGEDLHARVTRTGPLELGEVCRILGELAHALSRAHAAGIVHRDLKPENVFLATSRREGLDYTVKILDFGIAKVVAEATGKATARIGSPLWMAPEQTTSGAAITPAADLWALGLIVFYLLTGMTYWRSANVESPSQMELLREVAFEPLPGAGERAAALGCAAFLPPDFDAWFARLVVRDPAARFAQVSDALAALEALARASGALSAGAPPVGRVSDAAHARSQPLSQAASAWPSQPVSLGAHAGSVATPSSAHVGPAPGADTHASVGALPAGWYASQPASAQPGGVVTPPGPPAGLTAPEAPRPIVLAAPAALMAAPSPPTAQARSRRGLWLVGGLAGVALVTAVVVVWRLGAGTSHPAPSATDGAPSSAASDTAGDEGDPRAEGLRARVFSGQATCPEIGKLRTRCARIGDTECRDHAAQIFRNKCR